MPCPLACRLSYSFRFTFSSGASICKCVFGGPPPPIRNSQSLAARAFTLLGRSYYAVVSAKAGRCHWSLVMRHTAFTLLELLVVIAIIAILMVFVAPAFTTVKTGNDLANAAYAISGVLEQARNYAMANNTYVYVGFYEEDAASLSATKATPPYPGKGRLLLAVVASRDGTTACEDSNSTLINPISLTANNIIQIGKLVKIEGIHITDIGAPSPSPSVSSDPNSISGRPDLPYTYASPGFDYLNRINSDETNTENHTKFPFTAQGYTFYKTIRFSPQGEANINATYDLRRAAEIGLRLTRGATVDTKNPNVVAIQFSGVGGNFKIYRQ
jgi:prepilin-type N-terminal cleavage/methylation domain-containing protein